MGRIGLVVVLNQLPDGPFSRWDCPIPPPGFHYLLAPAQLLQWRCCYCWCCYCECRYFYCCCCDCFRCSSSHCRNWFDRNYRVLLPLLLMTMIRLSLQKRCTNAGGTSRNSSGRRSIYSRARTSAIVNCIWAGPFHSISCRANWKGLSSEWAVEWTVQNTFMNRSRFFAHYSWPPSLLFSSNFFPFTINIPFSAFFTWLGWILSLDDFAPP